MKYILALQTAEYPNSVALLDEKGKTVENKVFKEEEQTVERLGKLVKGVSKCISQKDLLMVAVCLGPGSYTGLRAGLAFAKGFCQFADIALVGVDAFQAVEADTGQKSVNILLDAKNERVFYKDKDKIKVDDLSKALKSLGKVNVFCGSGAVKYRKYLQEFCKSSNILDIRLSASGVGRAALKAYQTSPSIFSKDYLYNVRPLYILPPKITKSSNVKIQK
ncbi:MAG: tRNA (adenosine(37)-N6)-threonylcarbamoyltransferase complex dimerization subunit type 1 TsaB [Candidatus Dojkabacteria bacterium]|nr:tRNA (adenosine(37)-N6)-threonylcarbamoyltransferase complex dimerization subunit type 1 TsaB [Candidatus Dojkabacteria bacterium]